jgi:hypothetical protein
MIDDSVDDGITMDALFSAPSTPVVSDLKEEMVVYFHLGFKRRIKRSLIFICNIKELCADPSLMSTQMKKNISLPYIFFTWGASSLCMTAMNRIPM